MAIKTYVEKWYISAYYCFKQFHLLCTFSNGNSSSRKIWIKISTIHISYHKHAHLIANILDISQNCSHSELTLPLSLDKGERDMIIMRNDVGIRHSSGELETKHISLVVYGEPDGFSAMAKTVGYPAAIAAHMVLNG